MRERSLVEIYRDAPLMRQLRRPDQFKGRCGCANSIFWCGGLGPGRGPGTGDALETDPMCPYQPSQRYAQVMAG